MIRSASRCLALLVVACMVLSLVGCASGQTQQPKAPEPAPEKQEAKEETIVLKLGTIDAVTNPATDATNKFAQLVNERTNGKVKIDVYPASQLGNATDQIQAVMTGAQDMFQGALTFFGEWAKDWNIVSLAFGFRDQHHQRAFLKSDVNRQIEEGFRQGYGVRVICNNWLRPPNIIVTSRPVKSLQDLKGLKMRVPEIEMYMLNWKQLGCGPTVVAWGEVYMALRQKVVEGVDTPFDFIRGMKFHEVSKNVTMTNHLLTNAVVIINDKVWEKIPSKYHDIMRKAADEAGDYYTQMAMKACDDDRVKLLEEKINIIEVDLEPFRKQMAPLAYQLEKKGYWKAGLYDAVQAIGK